MSKSKSKMIVKIHKSKERKILAVCDNELFGKKLEEGRLQLDLSSEFYDGEEVQEDELLNLFKGAQIINLVGEKSINTAIKAGIIDKKNIVRIKNIPHAQAILV